LIDEDTYPWLIKKFLYFDKTYMMPIFKRPTKLRKRGGKRAADDKDDNFGLTEKSAQIKVGDAA